jgi:nucleotide-binding universal stress UspA family protein
VESKEVSVATNIETSVPSGGKLGASPDYLVVVVGFDGSDASERALESAKNLIAGRVGVLVVVFVARTPGTAAMSPSTIGEIRYSLDAEAQQLERMLPALLGDERRWRFERRDGEVADQLMSVAREQGVAFGPDASVMVVVGKASKRLHHLVGSVPVALVRHECYPVVVVP